MTYTNHECLVHKLFCSKGNFRLVKLKTEVAYYEVSVVDGHVAAPILLVQRRDGVG